jgi:nucleotide-binding universal stress UspA family protein
VENRGIARKDLIEMAAGIAWKAPRIVVGVDGSPSSRAALRWAVTQAVLIGGTVDAVMAWHIPMGFQGYAWAPIYVDEARDVEEDARKTLDAVISEEVEVADSHRVTGVLVNGHPAEVLLDAAADADLLVVGSRGHGAVADALLGSVGWHCVHHAHCPVVIMRDEPTRAAA